MSEYSTSTPRFPCQEETLVQECKNFINLDEINTYKVLDNFIHLLYKSNNKNESDTKLSKDYFISYKSSKIQLNQKTFLRKNTFEFL